MTYALYAAAVVLFAGFLAVGFYAARRAPGPLDRRAAALRGTAVGLALLLTKSGRGPFLTAASIAAIALFAAARWTLWVPFAMTLSQILSQTVVELVKARFGRVRPDYWIVGLDAGHSYPSGHSVTAIVFYFGWALVAASSPLPGGIHVVIAALLALWGLGVAWSRLALGAHYLSDVAGGLLFGLAWLCAAYALTMHFLSVKPHAF